MSCCQKPADAAPASSCATTSSCATEGAKCCPIAKLQCMGSCLGPLVLRLSIAAFMIPHGYGKITHWDATIEGFKGMNIPAPMTAIAILTEFFGPILLILGLGTRFASLFLLILITVAAFKGGHVDKGFTDPAGYAQHVLFGGACLALMLVGPGKVALDSVVCCILKKKRCCTK